VRLHSREDVVTRARLDLADRILDWRRTHEDLTCGEMFSVLGDVGCGQIANLAKYLIREERHPDDPDKPGGLA
jgi:hypothetical protein